MNPQSNSDGDFKPISEIFVAQFERPEHLEPINLRTLTPFQRALLVIDGTVTRFIEAYAMEPIEIKHLGQATCPLSEENTWLEAPSGTDVVVRQVQLRGEHTSQFYAFAISILIPDRLPDPINRNLKKDGSGLGRILLASRLENYREVLWFGKENPRELPPSLESFSDEEFISRTYRIITGGRPIMLINEKFLLNSDPLPSHH